MTRIERILVPLDFGDPGAHALAYAVELASKLGASVHAITAYEHPLRGFPDGVLTPAVEFAAQLLEATQKALDMACAPYKDGKVPLTSAIEQGDPREVILSVARQRQMSLIVMGTHGRKGIARALIGSVTEAIVRASEIPVLTVH